MARKCSITGKEMKNGWVVLEGEMYIADEKDVLEYIKKLAIRTLKKPLMKDIFTGHNG